MRVPTGRAKPHVPARRPSGGGFELVLTADAYFADGMQPLVVVLTLAAAAFSPLPRSTVSRPETRPIVDRRPPAQAKAQFRARLSPVPIDVAMQSTIAGSGTGHRTLAGTKLTVTGTFAGLKTPATVARIHVGAAGLRGPPILDLNARAATSGTLSGTFELTPQQVDDLIHSSFYIQLHSEKAPGRQSLGLAASAGGTQVKRALRSHSPRRPALLGLTPRRSRASSRRARRSSRLNRRRRDAASTRQLRRLSSARTWAGATKRRRLPAPNFMNTWRDADDARAVSSTSRRRCRREARTLTAEAYLAVTAHILQANGAPAGAQAFTAATAAPIGSHRDGCDRRRAQVRLRDGATPAAGTGRRRRRAVPRRAG